MAMELTLECEKTINVKLDDGSYGVLSLEKGSFPTLKRANMFEPHFPQDTDELHVSDYISGGQSSYYLSGRHDFLYDNESFNHVYTGAADRGQITQVSFIMPQLSVYFNHEIKKRFEKGGDISAQTNIEPLHAKLINSHHIKQVDIFQSKRLKDNDKGDGFIFINTLDITFTYDTPVSMEDITKLMVKVTNLFTWLFGTPSYITRVDLFDNESNKGYLYVPTRNVQEAEKVSSPYQFMPADQLRASFQSICQGYFVDNVSLFDSIWSKTIPLFHIKNVLEYELMLYASILDKYFSYRVDLHGLSTAMPQGDYTNLISRITSLLEHDPLIAGAIGEDKIVDIANETNLKRLIPNRSAATLNKRAKTYLRYIGKAVSDVFINDKDFYQIKEIRDRAAHGEMETLSTQQVYLYLNKIKMLTMYLIYRDLGVSDDSFLELLCMPYHQIKQACRINSFKRDVALNKANIMQVDEATFNFLKNKRGIFNFVFYRVQHTYHVDKELSHRLKTEFFGGDNKNSKFRTLEDFVQNRIFDKNKAAYISESYIQSGKQTHLLSGIVVIDKLIKLQLFRNARIAGTILSKE